MSRRINALATALVVSLSLPVKAQPDAPGAAKSFDFQPQEQWRLNELPDGCSVRRDFIRGEERVTFSIKRIHPRSAVQFAVIGSPISQDVETLEAGFLPSTNLQTFDRVAEAAIGERKGFVFAGPLFAKGKEGDKRPEGSDVTHFVIVDSHGEKITLHTRAIDQAIMALDACVTQKLRDFGLDLDAHSRLSKHVTVLGVGDLAKTMQRNYPKEALRNGWNGAVTLRLIINGQGQVTHCHVTNFLTAKVLRDAACKAMIQHARFEPAMDAQGNPATDFAFQQIRYVKAGGERPLSADAHGFAIRHDD